MVGLALVAGEAPQEEAPEEEVPVEEPAVGARRLRVSSRCTPTPDSR